VFLSVSSTDDADPFLPAKKKGSAPVREGCPYEVPSTRPVSTVSNLEKASLTAPSRTLRTIVLELVD
jgi:hypothetical protein